MKRHEGGRRKTRLTTPTIDAVRALASTVGLVIPDEDLDPLLAALRSHLASMTQLDELELGDSEPIVLLDPRWS